jgi:hypothetical protein
VSEHFNGKLDILVNNVGTNVRRAVSCAAIALFMLFKDRQQCISIGTCHICIDDSTAKPDAMNSISLNATVVAQCIACLR